MAQKVDIAIITVREDEHRAVLKRFRSELYQDRRGRTYGLCPLRAKGGRHYTVAIARCSEQGNDISQQLAHDIIRDLDPRLLLVVGIAGGVPHNEFTLGDVILSSRIYNENVGARKEDGEMEFDVRGGVHPRIGDITSNLPLREEQLTGWNEQAAIGQERPHLNLQQVTITGNDEWCQKVHESLLLHFGKLNHSRPPKFKTGSIASSNYLIRDPSILIQWLTNARTILAVEMETAGVYQAAQQIKHVYPVMAIRGISDIIGLKRDAQWTEYACQTAAAFAYAFVMTGPIEPAWRISRRRVARGLGGLVVLAATTGGGLIWSAAHSQHFLSPSSPGPTSHPTPTPIPLGTLLQTYRGHSDGVSAVVWSPDGKRLASGSWDNTVRVWDVATGSLINSYRGVLWAVYAVAWSPNGQRIVSTYDKLVQVWDATTGDHVLTYAGHSTHVNAVAWSPDGRRIATGSNDHTAQVWDAVTGRRIYTYQGHSDKVFAVAWSPDGKYIASGSHDKTVQVWDAATGSRIYTYRGHSNSQYGSVNAVAWPPNSRRIASASDDSSVESWNATTGSHVSIYTGHTSGVIAVAWSPDGKRIASGSYDKTVRIWDAASSSLIYTYRRHSDWVYSVAWSPDGRRIASGSTDKTVQVWGAG